MMPLCACAGALDAIKNKHSFFSPFCLTPSTPPKHTYPHIKPSPSPLCWDTLQFYLLLRLFSSSPYDLPSIATRSFMHPLGWGGNVREAHFSPAGVDRSTPPNEKGKGVIVKHVSLLCQNTTQAQWLHPSPPMFRRGIHPLIYGSWDKHPWTVLVC